MIFIACVSLILGLWLLRFNRFPRVQVRVLKTWEEVTGYDDGVSMGWLHADIEYWYQSQKYSVHWRGDLMQHRFLPDAVWMTVDPESPNQVRMPADWAMSCVPFFLIATIAGLAALRSFLN